MANCPIRKTEIIRVIWEKELYALRQKKTSLNLDLVALLVTYSHAQEKEEPLFNNQ